MTEVHVYQVTDSFAMETEKFVVKVIEEVFYEIEADKYSSIEELFDLIQVGQGKRIESYLTEDYSVADRSTFEEGYPFPKTLDTQ